MDALLTSGVNIGLVHDDAAALRLVEYLHLHRGVLRGQIDRKRAITREENALSKRATGTITLARTASMNLIAALMSSTGTTGRTESKMSLCMDYQRAPPHTRGTA